MGVEMTQREMDDFKWREDAQEYGWTLPPILFVWKLWGIRHVRALYHSWRVDRVTAEWAGVGIGMAQPAPRDLWMLYAIYRGWA